MRRTLSLSLCLLLATLAAAAQNLDAVVERVRTEFNVPGIAVAIVKDGRVITAKGYGVRRLGAPDPVTPDTLFGIASNTKAFTAAALAMLVDEGKLRWDDPVIQHMPSFQMYDAYVTREMTVRDLLVHRSGLGLGAGDLMFWPASDLSRDDVIRRLRFIKPAASFRATYAYDNILYLVAGQLIPAITGTTWDDFIRTRIFAPLGMTHSNVSIADNPPNGDVAIPHAMEEGKLRPIAFSALGNNAPAGAINSSVNDLSKWVITQLNAGRMSDGKELFSQARSREMWTPVTIMPTRPPAQDDPPALAATRANFNTYALGWIVSDYRGHKMVHHTGGLAGQVSRVTMIPDLGLGVIVLTNQEAGAAFNAITYSVLDQYLQAPAVDWVATLSTITKRSVAKAKEAMSTSAAKRAAVSLPSLKLAEYAGRYCDAWYGDVVIEERAGKLEIRFTHSPEMTGTLEHWQYDTFIARWNNRTMDADAYVTFSLKPDGSISEIRMAAVSPLTDFSYDFHDLLLKPVAAGTPAW